MSIAIEATELMERFQCLTTEEARVAVQKPDETSAVADELADADADADADYAIIVVGLIYCLSLSNAFDLDFSSAVLGKLQTNEHRYPAEEFRDPPQVGRFRRPDREGIAKPGALFCSDRTWFKPCTTRGKGVQ